MQIDDERANGICSLGGGPKTCSFLGNSVGSWQCLKGTEFEAMIISRREKGDIGAKGDNCSGPPDFTPTTEEPAAN